MVMYECQLSHWWLHALKIFSTLIQRTRERKTAQWEMQLNFVPFGLKPREASVCPWNVDEENKTCRCVFLTAVAGTFSAFGSKYQNTTWKWRTYSDSNWICTGSSDLSYFETCEMRHDIFRNICVCVCVTMAVFYSYWEFCENAHVFILEFYSTVFVGMLLWPGTMKL
jgi:hypothetical protein